MRSVLVPDERLPSKKFGVVLPSGAALHSYTGFKSLVLSGGFVTFLRKVISIIEGDYGLKGYHLRVVNIEHVKQRQALSQAERQDKVVSVVNSILDCFTTSTFFTSKSRANLSNSVVKLFDTGCDSNSEARVSLIDLLNIGFVIFFTGTSESEGKNEVPRALALEQLDTKIEYTDASGVRVSLPLTQRDIMVAEGKHCRVFLDAKGRNKLVSTCKRFVRRQTELSDDELAELWKLPMDLLIKDGKADSGFKYLDCRINTGTYQNIAHLHLKVAVDDDCMLRWNNIVLQLKARRNSRKGEPKGNTPKPKSLKTGYKVLALVSGGKDSTYNMHKCVEYGHEIVALANLFPKPVAGELDADSFCFQSVGHNVIPMIAECMGLPLFRRETTMKAKLKTMSYKETEGDEVEDLFELIKKAKESCPEITAVASGAIFSDYQRIRVENVCTRLGLVSLSYLWRRDQSELLEEMRLANINAIIIKIASLGLTAKSHLGRSVTDLSSNLNNMKDKFGLNVCGEGGEYETLTLDCDLYKKRIVVDDSHVESIQDDGITEVALYIIDKCHCEPKITNRDEHEMTCDAHSSDMAFEDVVLVPPKYKKVGKHIHLSSICVQNCDTLAAETAAVMMAMRERLETLGASMKDVLFVHLFVDDMSNFGFVNNVYKKFFGSNPPSRACVQAYLPEGSKVMADCFAHIGSGDTINDDRISLPRKVLHVQSISEWAPTCIGPYSQSNVFAGLIYQAGQIALKPGTMKLVDGGLLMELKQAFDNVASVYEALHSKLENSYSCTVYISQRYDFSECKAYIMEVCKKRLPQSCEMIDIVGIPELPRSAAVEIEVCGVTTKLRKIISDWDKLKLVCNNGIECRGVFIPTGFLSCSIKCTATNFDQAAILDLICKVLDSSKLSSNELFHIRIFYPAHSDALNIKMLQNFAINMIPGNSSLSFVGCNSSSEVILRIEGRDLQAFHAQVWLRDWPYGN